MPYRVHRESQRHPRRRAGDRRRRDPHDGDQRARGRRGVVCAMVRRPCVRGLGPLLRGRRQRRSSASAKTTSPGTREEETATRSGSSSPASRGQGPRGWDDSYSWAVLERAAEVVAEICARHAIPVRRLRRRRSADRSPRHHRPRRCQRGVPQERPLGSRRRLPVGALPPARARVSRAAATSSSAPRRPEASSSSSARVITSGGEI